jgi:SPP1 gp7 family putative phage head morphogenesis protein
MSREQIYEVYGIPLWLVGMQGGDNLGAGGAARSSERMFWEHTMDPLISRLEWALTIGLLQRFDESWHCRYDTSGVYCLQVAFLERADLVQKACGRAVLTVNEGREILDREPLDDPKYDELQEPVAPGFGGDAQTPGAEDPGAGGAAASKAGQSRMRDRAAGDKSRSPSLPRPAGERRHHLSKAMDREARHAARYVVRLFNQQEARLLAQIPEQRAAAKRVVDLVALLSEAPEDRELVEDMITDLFERRGQDALSELIQGADFKSTNARAASYISRQTNRALANTSATTRELLNERMADAAGESMEGLIAVVRGVFDDRRENAVTIARTESASAFNAANLEAWKQTDGAVTGKRWVAVDDENTRPEHREADGQAVGLDDGFQVGGELLQFPGDPDASPELSINCRCAVDFVLAEERGQRAILEFINGAMGRTEPSRNGHSRLAAIFQGSKEWS